MELDNIKKLAQVIGLDFNVVDNRKVLLHLLERMISIQGVFSSGCVIYGHQTYELINSKPNHCGILFNIGLDYHELDSSLYGLEDQWSLDDISNNYGIAKIDLFYNPNETKALEKKQFLAKIYQECQQKNLQLLVKLYIYNIENSDNSNYVFEELQLQAIEELRNNMDVLALQFPGSALSCSTVTAQLDMPWILNLPNSDFEQTKSQLQTSLENGASGLMTNDYFINQFQKYKSEDASPDITAIETFLTTLAKTQMFEFKQIVDEYHLQAKNDI